MRISDWSSDVCSSDLREWVEAEALCDALQLAGRRFVEAEPEKFALGAFAGDRLFGAEVADELSLVVEAGGHDRHRRTSCWFRRTIGLGAGAAGPVRASCDRPGSPSVRRSRRRGGAGERKSTR